MRSLAIIEQDQVVSRELRSATEAAGFHTETFARADDALSDLRRRSFSLAIVDLELDDVDPFALCSEASSLLPVIALSPGYEPDVCVRALEAGADDCLRQPVARRELIARIESVLRRTRSDDDAIQAVDDLSISIPEMRIRSGSVTHRLTKGETEVLSLLLQEAPKPVTAAEIATTLAAKRGTIESRIKSLRRKLGEGRLISRGKFGYQLQGLDR